MRHFVVHQKKKTHRDTNETTLYLHDSEYDHYIQKMSTSCIVLISLGAVIVVVFFVLLLYWRWRNKRRAPTGDLQGLFVERTVTMSDIEGKWFEIARIDSSFEPQNMTDVTAEYKKRSDGTIKVTNQGYVSNAVKTAVGTAWPTPTSGVFKVSFFPFVSSAYVVLDARRKDNAVEQFVVGSPSRKYLWLLSRTPTIEFDALTYARNIAKQNGYQNANQVHLTTQNIV
jgi:apolipoprotein D and lipocalin family protein